MCRLCQDKAGIYFSLAGPPHEVHQSRRGEPCVAVVEQEESDHLLGLYATA
jgi:hypothetical protein